jgi:hypothetical protein
LLEKNLLLHTAPFLFREAFCDTLRRCLFQRLPGPQKLNKRLKYIDYVNFLEPSLATLPIAAAFVFFGQTDRRKSISVSAAEEKKKKPEID